MGFEEACLVGALHPEAMRNNQISLSSAGKKVFCVSCEDMASSTCACFATPRTTQWLRTGRHDEDRCQQGPSRFSNSAPRFHGGPCFQRASVAVDTSSIRNRQHIR